MRELWLSLNDAAACNAAFLGVTSPKGLWPQEAAEGWKLVSVATGLALQLGQNWLLH